MHLKKHVNMKERRMILVNMRMITKDGFEVNLPVSHSTVIIPQGDVNYTSQENLTRLLDKANSTVGQSGEAGPPWRARSAIACAFAASAQPL